MCPNGKRYPYLTHTVLRGCDTVNFVQGFLTCHTRARHAGGVKRPPLLDDVGWLTAAYVTDGRSTSDIAAELGCSPAAVTAALRRHGIEVRGRGQARRFDKLEDVDWLKGRYVDDEASSADIAAELGCHPNSVLDALARHGIERRTTYVSSADLDDVGWLTDRYIDRNWSTTRIAAEVGCSAVTVSLALRRHGIAARPVQGANTTGTNRPFREAVNRHVNGTRKAPPAHPRSPDPDRHLLVRVDRGWLDPGRPLLLRVAPQHTFAALADAARDGVRWPRPSPASFYVSPSGMPMHRQDSEPVEVDLEAAVCATVGPGWHLWLALSDVDPVAFFRPDAIAEGVYSVRPLVFAPHPLRRCDNPEIVTDTDAAEPAPAA